MEFTAKRPPKAVDAGPSKLEKQRLIHPNHGKPWSRKDDEFLEEAILDGEDWSDVSESLGRYTSAVQIRFAMIMMWNGTPMTEEELVDLEVNDPYVRSNCLRHAHINKNKTPGNRCLEAIASKIRKGEWSYQEVRKAVESLEEEFGSF